MIKWNATVKFPNAVSFPPPSKFSIAIRSLYRVLFIKQVTVSWALTVSKENKCDTPGVMWSKCSQNYSTIFRRHFDSLRSVGGSWSQINVSKRMKVTAKPCVSFCEYQMLNVNHSVAFLELFWRFQTSKIPHVDHVQRAIGDESLLVLIKPSSIFTRTTLYLLEPLHNTVLSDIRFRPDVTCAGPYQPAV